MSKDHGAPDSLNDKERSNSINETRDDVVEDKIGDSATTFTQNVIPTEEHEMHDDEKTEEIEALSQLSEHAGPSHSDEDETPQEEPDVEEALERLSTRTPLHSVFSPRMKRFIVFMTAWGGIFSPIAANIYFAALNPLADALHVSDSLINLSLTSYMIFQGLAPSIFGDLADEGGRRPAFIISLTVFLFACIGLALQTNFGALIVLRCLQSFGSSATIALAQGIIADIATSAERGTYVGYVQAPMTLGQCLGPFIGGILSQFLGWRAIFWFCAIFVVCFLIPYIIFVPETSRNVVGNGSIPPEGWNQSLLVYLKQRKLEKRMKAEEADGGISLSRASTREQQRLAREAMGEKRKLRWPNPFRTVKIVLQKENASVLAFNTIIFIAFIDTLAGIPSIFARNYNFNDLQIGCCYIPFGAGSAISTFANGKILDWNFRRLAIKNGFPVDKKRQADLRHFPIELARLQVAIPLFWVAAAMMLIYAWLLQRVVHYAGPLVLIFFIGYTVTGAFNVLSTLMVDLNLKSPATATAAINLVRCLIGAGTAAVIVPMINGIGEGWAYTLHSLFLLVTSPLMLGIIRYGPRWREERYVKEEKAEQAKHAENGNAQFHQEPVTETNEKKS